MWMVWLILGCVIVVFALSYCCYWVAFYNPVERHNEAVVIRRESDPECLNEMCEQMSEQECERVYIRSFDGVTLAGRYYHRSDDGPILIQFHGYRGNGVRDFCFAHHICSKNNISSLVVDQRAHGESGGNTMTFGILERKDCLCWARYVQNRFGSTRKIFLSGVSMGAATVLMASALPLPENVSGIIADCSYSAPGGIIRKVISDMRVSSGILYPFVVLGALVFGGFRIWEATPLDAVEKTTIPILLIHGSEDRFVPCEMSSRIFEHCKGEKYLEIFPGAGHGGCCANDPVRYEKILASFMNCCQ